MTPTLLERALVAVLEAAPDLLRSIDWAEVGVPEETMRAWVVEQRERRRERRAEEERAAFALERQERAELARLLAKYPD